MNITVRSIPEEVVSKLKTVALKERRSLNSEILCLLEKSLDEEVNRLADQKKALARQSQLEVWEKLCGAWEDDRSSEEIVADIVEHRTDGREVEL